MISPTYLTSFGGYRPRPRQTAPPRSGPGDSLDDLDPRGRDG